MTIWFGKSEQMLLNKLIPTKWEKSGLAFPSSIRQRGQNGISRQAEGMFLSRSLKTGGGQWAIGQSPQGHHTWDHSANFQSTFLTLLQWRKKKLVQMRTKIWMCGYRSIFKAMQIFLKAVFLHSSSNCCLILSSSWCFREKKRRMKWNLPVDPEHSSKLQFFLS